MRNRQGFGLLEILVSLAIMGVITMGFMQMMSNNWKSQKGVKDASDLNSFGTELSQIMNQNAGCTVNLTLGGTGGQALQFDSSLISTTPGTLPPLQNVLTAIYYPMAVVPATTPPTYTINPNSPLIATSAPYQNYQNWQVTEMGVRVLGQEGTNVYNISVEVDFKKINTQSFGGLTGLRQATAVTVTTTPTTGSNVQVTGCAGGQQLGCPTGMSLVPGNISQGITPFCIDTIEDGPIGTSNNYNPSYFCALNYTPSRTACTPADIYNACQEGVLPGTLPNNEITAVTVDYMHVAYVSKNCNPAANPFVMIYPDPNIAGFYYRCCLH